MSVIKKGWWAFRNLLSYFLVFWVVLVLLPVLFILFLLPASCKQVEKLTFSCIDLLYKGITGALLVPLHISGKSHIPSTPAIIVANHQSSLDIPLVGMLLDGYPHMWYALAYYANFPILGLFIRKLGVPIDRSNLTNAARALIKGIKLVDGANRHVVIFPEGGRFNDGTVHEFLRGFAVIARTTKRPVVPVFMPHNGEMFPPPGILMYPRSLSVTVGKPFVYEKEETDEQFVHRVHDWFEQKQAQVSPG